MFPKLFQWGDFFIPTYGVLLAIAFLTALWLAGRLGRSVGLNTERIMDIGLIAALSGIAGAKLAMFLFDWDYYSAHPGQIFSLGTLQAAGVFQGGLILALFVSIWYMRRKHMPVLRTMDVFAPGHRHRARHRTRRLFRRRLLLGRSDPPALGGDVHQPGIARPLRHAASISRCIRRNSTNRAPN